MDDLALAYRVHGARASATPYNFSEYGAKTQWADSQRCGRLRRKKRELARDETAFPL